MKIDIGMRRQRSVAVAGVIVTAALLTIYGGSSSMQPSATNASNNQRYQMLSLGLPVAGLAAFFGIRHLRKISALGL